MGQFQKTARVRILGRVQGVSFRVWTRDEAQKLGLAGWVKNEPDGSVAALINGSEEAVTTMLERLRKGPPMASVTQVITEFVETTGEFQGFRITR
ncbi:MULTISPECIES: acylphosphatase [unclassified Ensifer]|uniref:acylphosphatase n=1 Tax=unclassified Ensifer TaxID=2633371 RepID=UPI000812D64E|nr:MULTISPECIES: acylphosphatase [unclassified Ensifer]OCP00198.1 acylphosphatase [Ensifer sp. LC11]OCP00412.1 acylphosphatase [Ensifer sp. LC13]OCP04180.1 acylphosphatase [Ensifer sp. LC14]OCP31399.1 acylphosphatase [Ensifer sp. LC499]